MKDALKHVNAANCKTTPSQVNDVILLYHTMTGIAYNPPMSSIPEMNHPHSLCACASSGLSEVFEGNTSRTSLKSYPLQIFGMNTANKMMKKPKPKAQNVWKWNEEKNKRTMKAINSNIIKVNPTKRSRAPILYCFNLRKPGSKGV